MLLIMPRSCASPTTEESMLFVMLWVMSTRRRLSPFGDDVAFVNDEAGLVAAVLDRPDRIAERLAAESLVVIEREIARILRFGRDRVVDCGFEQPGIEAGFGRRLALPLRIGEIQQTGFSFLGVRAKLERGPEV